MENSEWLDGCELIYRAFDRFRLGDNYSNDLVIARDFIESAVAEVETESSLNIIAPTVIVIAAKLMQRIVKARPISFPSDTLNKLDKYKLVNEKFAFELGVKLIGVELSQIGIDNLTAKRLADHLHSPDCNEAYLRFCLKSLRISVLGRV